jgi:hypothetical protein
MQFPKTFKSDLFNVRLEQEGDALYKLQMKGSTGGKIVLSGKKGMEEPSMALVILLPSMLLSVLPFNSHPTICIICLLFWTCAC